MKKRISLLVIALVATCTSVLAQQFDIKKIELSGDNVIIHYQLIDTTKSRSYTINVYSSRDNFLTPLQKLTGDVGLEVKPGVSKKITWNSRQEMGTAFKGDLEIEIRGRVYIPFVRFNDFTGQTVMRRGKLKTLTWSGGTRQNILNFAIYNTRDEFIDVIPNIANSGSAEIPIPRGIKPDDGYYFIVSDSKNKDQAMKTAPFTIKPKIPLLLKALPIVVVGAGAFLLAPKPGPDELGTPPGSPETPN